MRLLIWTLVLISVPWVAHAASLGFPQGPLWLSNATPTDGDQVTIYTAVYDSATSTLAGTLAFRVDGTDLATSTFALRPGESRIIQHSWRATTGVHVLDAEIRDAVPALGDMRTASVHIEVTPAPPSPIAEYVNGISNAIASSSPVLHTAENALYSVSETVRDAGMHALSRAIDSVASNTAAETTAAGGIHTGRVLGAETHRSASTTPEISHAISVLDGIRIALTGVRSIFATKALFYPLFWLLVVGFLIWIFRRMRRERID